MRSALIRLISICALFLAALSAGYALSSSLGQGALRREAEDQLAKLMRGRVTIERADLRIRSGLWIEGRNVQVYPNANGPGLSSDRVSARVDVIALLAGRFRLQDLILDGIHLEIERSLADRWSPYPIDAIDKRGEGSGPDDLERKLSAFRVIDVITRVLLERPFIAQRIEVSRGSVRLVDRYVGVAGAAPFRVEIASIRGTLVHDWIGNRAELELSGQLSDERRSPVPIELFGERRTDGGMVLSLSVTKLALESYRDYFQDQRLDARRAREAGEVAGRERPFAGMLSGVVRFDTPEPAHGVLEIDWSADQTEFGIARGDEILSMSSPRIQLRSRIEIHPGRLRISDAELRGPDLRIDLSGDIERPLRESSLANLSLEFRDVGPEALVRIANVLPVAEREPLLRALTRIEEGRIVRVGGRGKQRLSVWQAVLRGDRLDLPREISMLAEVAGVTAQLGEHERLTDLSGSATWTRDRLDIALAHARRDGVPTPRLNLTIVGFPALFERDVGFDESRVSNAGLPGIALLESIFAVESVAEDYAEDRPEDHVKLEPHQPIEIEVQIDYLEHSALLWPLRDARVLAVLHEGGQSFRIAKGVWAGAQVRGDVLFSHRGEPTIDAQLEVWVPAATGAAEPGDSGAARAAPLGRSAAASAPEARDRDPSGPAWAAGKFVIEGLHGKHWPVGPTVAGFAFRGESLQLDEIRGRLVPRGHLEGNFQLDLSSADQLAFDTHFKILDGRAGPLLEAVGFPDNFATGTLDVEGSLGGPIVPGRPAFAEVVGQIEIAGRDGEIRQSIPLAAALAHAAEGLSPSKASNALAYETLESVLRIERGSIASDEIKLDGPLRVFLSGRFDFARPGRAIDAEIGIFIFRQIDRLLGGLPLLGNLIPGGRDRGLFGMFFKVSGSLEEPQLETLPMKSLTDGIPLPDLVRAPFSAIREALQGSAESAP